jgi:hypothetical protein
MVRGIRCHLKGNVQKKKDSLKQTVFYYLYICLKHLMHKELK